MQIFSSKSQLIVFLIILWMLVWKGIALWKSARNNHKKWFVALLILNTFGILEMIYIFIFGRRRDKRALEKGQTQ